MNSFLRRLLYLFGLVAAVGLGFAAGYGFHKGGSLALAPQAHQEAPQVWADNGNTALPASVSGPTPVHVSAPPTSVLTSELYQQVWMLLERDFDGPDPSVTERTYGTVRGLVESYNDPYTYFVEPQPRQLERDQLRGRFGGIGAWIEQDADGFFLRPMPDRPAAQAGVQAGDRLLAVDGQPVTPDTPVDAVTSMIRGPVDTEVCLNLSRTGEDGTASALTICIVRAEIETPSVEWRLIEGDDIQTAVGYIRQTIFSERSASEMQTAIRELANGGADRFILDLRGNPGGLVDAAVDVASLWLDGGPVLIERKSGGEERVFTATPGDPSAGAPLVVIVDGSTASAAEIVAGALRDRGRALLVGEPTFGKGSVQLVHDLVDGSSLHVTTAHWFTPDHHALEGLGLVPDILVEAGTDPLQQAVNVVQEVASP